MTAPAPEATTLPARSPGPDEPLLLGLDLAGKEILLVGAGAVAERRLGDLLRAGARVRVVAPEATEAIAGLADGGEVDWHRRRFRPGDLATAWLVHTATGQPGVDAAVAAEASARRIWCVQATRGSEGTARFAARARLATPDGPVHVGVLASGDPGRAMAVRHQVQGLLDAGEVEARARRPRARGWVALVGGGPGDASLVTGRGRALLASADVVFADRLAPGEVETLCPDAEVIDVGKEVGAHATPQEAINELIVAHALAGRGVVRLKGGDPYVFGRGGEERLAVEAAGIPVEVVPGVTSAAAVPAAAGIPVTHRGVADGWTVVHGHGSLASVPGGANHTVVILMGVATLRASAALFAAGGRGDHCPVAVIERGCTPDQRVTVGDLGTIADRAAAVGVRAPAVVVVGDVVTLSPAWHGLRGAAPRVPGTDPAGPAPVRGINGSNRAQSSSVNTGDLATQTLGTPPSPSARACLATLATGLGRADALQDSHRGGAGPRGLS